MTDKKRLFCLLIMAIWMIMPALADTLQADQQPQFPELKGEYLGQKKPGMTPEIFAPGIVSTGSHDSTPVFPSDGKYLFFTSERNGNMDVYWMDAKFIDDLRKGIQESQKPNFSFEDFSVLAGDGR